MCNLSRAFSVAASSISVSFNVSSGFPGLHAYASISLSVGATACNFELRTTLRGLWSIVSISVGPGGLSAFGAGSRAGMHCSRHSSPARS